jgi:hypothetical protein
MVDTSGRVVERVSTQREEKGGADLWVEEVGVVGGGTTAPGAIFPAAGGDKGKVRKGGAEFAGYCLHAGVQLVREQSGGTAHAGSNGEEESAAHDCLVHPELHKSHQRRHTKRGVSKTLTSTGTAGD